MVVSDKVKIKSLDWYNTNKDTEGDIFLSNVYFVSDMSKYCGKEAIITKVESPDYYRIDLDNEDFLWTNEMFEGMKETKIKLPEGWEVDKIENGEIILKEIKKELPKTWEECVKTLKMCEYIDACSDIQKIPIISITTNDINLLPIGLSKPMLALCQLLVCREFYRQGWKPDWSDSNLKYVIEYKHDGDIRLANYRNIPRVLSFQSEEVRDEFAKNFEYLIKEAKELS